MTIPSISQVLTDLPDPPVKLDSDFDEKADAWVAAFPQLQTEVNTLASQINTTVSGINTGIADALTGATYKQAFLSYLRDTLGAWAIDVQPTLNLFCGAMTDDSVPLGTLTRSTVKTRRGPTGKLETVDAGLLARDWGADGTLLGWLVEEARTNYYVGDPTGSVADWGGTGVAMAGGFPAPDGTTNGVKIVAGGTTAFAYTLVDVPYYGTTDDYCPLVYIKRGNQRYATVNVFYTGLTEANVIVDFDNETVLNSPYSGEFTIEKYFDNWYLVGFRMLRNPSGVSKAITFQILPNNRDNVISGDYCYAFLPNIQYGSFPTSIIYPSATAPVTRAADSWAIPISSFPFNPSEGSLYVNFRKRRVNTTWQPILNISDGGYANRIYANVLAGHLYGNVLTNSETQAEFQIQDVVDTVGVRFALGWKQNNFSICCNGGQLLTDTNGIIPSGFTMVRIGTEWDGTSSVLNGHLSHLALFSNAEIDKQLITL